MFGRLINKNILISTILAGFCLYIIKLYIQGDLNLYIHPRYSLFSLIMCSISIIILAFNIFIELKNNKQKLTLIKFNFIDVIVVIMLLLAFLLPPQTLSMDLISRKSVDSSTYQAKSKSTICPKHKPGSIDELVIQLGQYTPNCFQGKSIELVGFLFENPDIKLPDNIRYFGRSVISCCIIDARAYAIPIDVSGMEKYKKNTWLKINGILQPTNINGSIQLTIEPKNVIEVPEPNDPYGYLNADSSAPPQIPLQ